MGPGGAFGRGFHLPSYQSRRGRFATSPGSFRSRDGTNDLSGPISSSGGLPSVRLGSDWAGRKPRLLFRFSGSFLLRFAERQFLALLFQLPPRITRFEACDRCPTRKTYQPLPEMSTRNLRPQQPREHSLEPNLMKTLVRMPRFELGVDPGEFLASTVSPRFPGFSPNPQDFAEQR